MTNRKKIFYIFLWIYGIFGIYYIFSNLVLKLEEKDPLNAFLVRACLKISTEGLIRKKTFIFKDLIIHLPKGAYLVKDSPPEEPMIDIGASFMSLKDVGDIDFAEHIGLRELIRANKVIKNETRFIDGKAAHYVYIRPFPDKYEDCEFHYYYIREKGIVIIFMGSVDMAHLLSEKRLMEEIIKNMHWKDEQ